MAFLGVDLGGSNAVAAVSLGSRGRVEVIANDVGSRTTPCVVGFLDEGDALLVGEGTQDLPPHDTLFDAKRLIGTSERESSSNAELYGWPFEVVREGLSVKMKALHHRALTPQEVCAEVLRSLKLCAEDYLSKPISKVVITIPPYFSENQCAGTREAGALAGFQEVELLCEAEAALLAHSIPCASTVLVLHVGGRSTHAWLRAGQSSPTGVVWRYDAALGGDDFDRRIFGHVSQDITTKHGVVLDTASTRSLLRACELLKRKLSVMHEASLSEFIQSIRYRTTLSRATFESVCAKELQRIVQLVEEVLKEAKLEAGAVDEVVLVGGSTRIPKVRSLLRALFGKEPRHSINPDEAVAQGAAVHAAVLAGDKLAVDMKDPPEDKETVVADDGPSTSKKIELKTEKVPLPSAAVGIDLGTTYSAVAVCRRGKVQVLANDSGSRITPSVVGFLGGRTYVGEAAKELPVSSQVYDVKRLVGRSWHDVVQADFEQWPFEVVRVDGVPILRVDVDGKKEDFAPEEISAMVLRDLKKTAEDALQQSVSKAVITVPAYFNERQRQATKNAGKVAGLEVLAMINEPTAAAIAYGLDRALLDASSDEKRTAFIYDFGGGTFDVSVVMIQRGVLTVLASGGDTHLGGKDLDARLVQHVMEDIVQKHNAEFDAVLKQELSRACELSKRKLSSLPETSITLYLPRLGVNYKATITRARFEALSADLFQKTIEISSAVLEDAKLEAGAVDEVVLVGGSTRIPKVRSLLRALFGKEPRHSINPDEAVAQGAAVHAAVLAGGDGGAQRLVELRDVTPLSMGVDIVGGRFLRIIPRNTPVPCKCTKEFYTVFDDQHVIDFEVFQGEREFVKDNYSLNKEFSISVPPMPAGQVKVDITFEIDYDGLLTVTCVERTTGEKCQVVVNQAEAGISDDDVKSMIEKAEAFRDRDEQEREKVEQALRDKLILF